MSVAARLKKFLESHKIGYRIFYSPTSLDASCCAKAVGVADDKGMMVAIIPEHTQLNLPILNKLTKRHFKLTSNLALDKLFFDCESGAHPILAEPYGASVIIDNSFNRVSEICFSSGTHTCFVKITKDDLKFLTANQLWGPIAHVIFDQSKISLLKQKEDGKFTSFAVQFNPCSDERRYERYHVPKLPLGLVKLIQLAKQNDLSFENILCSIEDDKDFAQSLCHYLQSQSYPKGHSVKDMLKGMEYESIVILAIKQIVEQGFQLPKMGPLGFNTFWLHAQSCALIAKKLAQACDAQLSISPKIASICGLLHNFGLLLLGHLYTPEFRLMNKLMAHNPKESLLRLERRILGMGGAQYALECGHAAMGAWLMRYWNMLDEVVVVSEFHHHLHYDGIHSLYVALIHLSDSLLSTLGVGDGDNTVRNAPIIQCLGLNSEIIEQTFQQFVNEHPSLSRVNHRSYA